MVRSDRHSPAHTLELCARDLPDHPEVFMTHVRGIENQAFELIWKAELGTKTIPSGWMSIWRYNQERGPDRWQTTFPQGGDRVQLLNLMTGTERSKRCARHITKGTHVLLNAAHAFGDFGQHQESAPIDSGTAYAVLHLCIELAAALTVNCPLHKGMRIKFAVIYCLLTRRTKRKRIYSTNWNEPTDHATRQVFGCRAWQRSIFAMIDPDATQRCGAHRSRSPKVEKAVADPVATPARACRAEVTVTARSSSSTGTMLARSTMRRLICGATDRASSGRDRSLHDGRCGVLASYHSSCVAR